MHNTYHKPFQHSIADVHGDIGQILSIPPVNDSSSIDCGMIV